MLEKALLAVGLAVGLTAAVAAQESAPPVAPPALEEGPPSSVTSATSAPAAPGEERRVRRTIQPGEAFEIDPLALEGVTVFEISLGEVKALTIRVTLDGQIRFVEVLAPVTVNGTGTGGNSVDFRLAPGEQVSLWAADRVVITAVAPSGSDGEGGLVVNVVMAEWAFTLLAEGVREGGLPVTCDGRPFVMSAGQRLDTVMRRGAVVFVLTGGTWESIALEPGAGPGPGAAGTPEVGVGAPGRVEPGVMGWPPWELPWEVGGALPSLTFVVFRPEDVSR